MIRTVGSVATDLQTIAHSGQAESEICIKILDTYYKIGDIKKLIVHGKKTREVYAIEARGFDEGCGN